MGMIGIIVVGSDLSNMDDVASAKAIGKSKKKLKATILIPWAFIISIVHFPEAEGYDFPNPFEQSIGF